MPTPWTGPLSRPAGDARLDGFRDHLGRDRKITEQSGPVNEGNRFVRDHWIGAGNLDGHLGGHSRKSTWGRWRRAQRATIKGFIHAEGDGLDRTRFNHGERPG